jgi:hypothetical protein
MAAAEVARMAGSGGGLIELIKLSLLKQSATVTLLLNYGLQYSKQRDKRLTGSGLLPDFYTKHQ